MAIGREKYFNSDRGPDLRKTGRQKTWVVSEMWDLHFEIARYVLLGWKNVDIAEQLGVTPQTISNVRNSPIVQEHLAIISGARDADTVDLDKEIKASAPTALKLLIDVINGDGEGTGAPISLRVKTAENMVARVGHGVPHKVQSENVHAYLTSADIEEIKRRAMESNDIVEGEVDE